MAPDRVTTPHEAEAAFAEAFRLMQTRAVDVLNAIDDGVFSSIRPAARSS